MKVKLVIVSPEVKPNEYDVTLPTKIGRGHEAKLKLVHPLVSRLHCELFNQGEQVFIRDLDSLNGTFVDQQRIDEDTPLPSGTTVMMGTVMFQLRYGSDRDRLPPSAAKKLDKTAAAEGTIRSETIERIAKPAAAPSDEELWDQTVEEPTAVVSEEESESLAFLDEEPGEKTPSPRPARKSSTPSPPAAKPVAPVDEDDDEPFTVAPIDEPAEEEPPQHQDKDDMDDFFKSIM
jgi:pSer/pThr/pTyr-binding forkhead associated (FHA) protein